MLVKANNEHLTSIVSSIAASAAVIEENIRGAYVVTALNSRFSDMFHGRSATRDTVSSSNPMALETIIPECGQAEFIENCAVCFSSGEPLEFLQTYQSRTGVKNWRISLKPVLGEDGRASVLVATAHDVTEKKLAEKQLTLANTRFAAVVEAAYDSIITINRQSQIILFNQAAQKLFGYSLDEIIGEPIETLMPEKYRAGHGDSISAFARMPIRSREMSDRSHVIGLHKNGREFPVEIAISKIDVHGTIEYTAIVRDASDRLRLLDQLAERARTDHLTGSLNRREFDVLGHELFETSIRKQTALSVLMLDLDHFKRINDNHGHHVGDEVLKFAAQLGEKNARGTDIFARMGGEEFALLMPDADERVAADMAERIRHTYERQSTRSRRGAPAVPFTVSIGIATLTEADNKLGDLLKRADKALYRAKQAGRNRVEIG